MTQKIDIIGLTRKELTEKLKELGIEAFRAKQIWHWIYTKGATDFARMTTIAKDQQKILDEHFIVRRAGITKDLLSIDGTRKWLLEFPDNNKVETVFIPEDDRGALCVSSQVGCTLTCTFCHTGTMKLVRNLSAGEIIGQVMTARDGLAEWGKKREECLFTNIVMMGMGEPLFNYENVAKALTIIMDGEGIAISKRKITLSTSGVVPMIEKCGTELGVNLAISLHAVRDELRERGLDTYDANLALGFGEDERDFSIAGAILKKLGVGKIRLLTNNPHKISAVENAGIKVSERVPLIIKAGQHNHDYLEAKEKKAGHIF